MNPLDTSDDDFSEFSDISDLPMIYPGVYRLSDENDKVLYVGQSCDVRRRLREHKRSKSWFPSVTKVEALFSADTEDQLIIETIQIFRHRPRHNKAIKLGLKADGSIFPLNFIRSSGGRKKKSGK